MKKPVDPDPRRALLDAMNAAAEAGGGAERVQKQHEAGRLTARSAHRPPFSWRRRQ